MHRLVVILLLLPLTLISCSEGNTKRDTCPDGEPIFIPKNLEDAFPAYVREYDAGLNVTAELLSKGQASATLKTKVVKLRQDLDQERSELETRQKTVLMALQMTPCDKAARANAWMLLQDIKTKTTQIPDRMKELNAQSSKIQSEISNLLLYPDSSRDIAKPPTILEASLANKLPRRLFELLNTYNDAAILNVPNVGGALRDHKIAYYEFRQRVTKLEAALMPRIGKMVAVQLSPGWKIYLHYLVVRFGGNSPVQIVANASNSFLNYDITWDDCERVFSELSKDQSISTSFSEAFAFHKSLDQGVSKIASAI